MRVAYYCPLKPPDHPVPSGDRRVARLLRRALRIRGHRVELASRLRALDPEGHPARQAAIARRGAAIAERLVHRYRKAGRGGQPDAWFTYHLYHKAPDHLGPVVARALGIPYVIAEASFAPKQAGGAWDHGHRLAEAAIRAADHVLLLSPDDAECVRPLRTTGNGLTILPPPIDTGPCRSARAARDDARASWAVRSGASPDRDWLLAVGMMRAGDKMQSYSILAKALRHEPPDQAELLIAGDGPARAQVEAAFADVPVPVRWLGEVGENALPSLYAACDLMTWPAVREAFGMAILEAQSTGLPVVAGHTPGVAAIVEDGITGLIVPTGNSAAFAGGITQLLGDKALRDRMGLAAMDKTRKVHDIDSAADRIDAVLQAVTARKALKAE